jgi:DNA-binding transcriptional LysR family regulator
LVEQGFDLAIRLGKLNDSTLKAKKLAQRRSYVCASPAYLERYGQPHALSELEQHNCLLGTLDYWRFSDGGSERNIRVSGSLRYNSGGALLDAALKGLGLVQLPDYYVEPYLQRGQLLALLENFAEQDQGVWAVYPPNRHLSPKVRLLIDFLAANITR